MSSLLSLTTLAQAVTAAAQSGASAIPPFTWSSWSGDGVLRAGLLLLVGAYLLGVGPLRKQYRLGPPASKGQIALYLSGVFCLLVALEGPIHELSDTYLFSAHMVQHMLLIYAAPPLMLLGMPGWLLRPVLRLPGVMRLGKALTNPFVALLGFNLVFSLYHIPLYYNAVVADHRLHVAAHLVFIVLAVMTWWPILSPVSELPRLSYPLQMIYVFAQTFSGFIVGSFITNSRTILYTFYLDAPRTWGLSAQDDQQLGGLIMWIVGGFYLLVVYSVIFFAWAHAEGVHDDVAVPVRPRPRRVAPVQPSTGAGQPTAAPGRNGHAAGGPGTNEQGSTGLPAAAAGSSVRSGVSSDEDAETPRVASSPLDLGARHVVTSAPDRSRLN